MRNIISIFCILLFLTGCFNKRFESEKWKMNSNFAQSKMLNDLIESQILIGKTKQEVISLLDTNYIKGGFVLQNDYWMYIIDNADRRATVSPVKILEVGFEGGEVTTAEIRK